MVIFLVYWFIYAEMLLHVTDCVKIPDKFPKLKNKDVFKRVRETAPISIAGSYLMDFTIENAIGVMSRINCQSELSPGEKPEVCWIRSYPFIPCDKSCRFVECRTLMESNFGYIRNLIVKTINYINHPMSYTVRETRADTPQSARAIDREINKPVHIVLDHSQVKELRQAGDGNHSSPLPHERRGHWRILRAERYKQKGKIWVRPADVNKGMTWEVETSTGKRFYEVIN